MVLSRDPTARPVAGLSGAGEGAVDLVRVRVLPDGRMSRKDAARYIGIAEKTMAMWQLQAKKGAPPSVRIAGRRWYFKTDLDQYLRDAAAGAV
jgi:hypothetical protein